MINISYIQEIWEQTGSKNRVPKIPKKTPKTFFLWTFPNADFKTA